MIKSNKGFTLIELLVVMVMLGILASIAVFTFGDFTDSADRGVVSNNMRSLMTELEVEKGESGNYPELDDTDPDDFASPAWEFLVSEDGIQEFEYERKDNGSSYEAVATIEAEDNNGDGVYIVITPGLLQEVESDPSS